MQDCPELLFYCLAAGKWWLRAVPLNRQLVSKKFETRRDTYNRHNKKLIQGTDSIKIRHPGYIIRMYWTNFWHPNVYVRTTIYFLKKKLTVVLQKFGVHIFTPLLVNFSSKLVNYSRHSEFLNIWKNSEIDDIFLR